HRSHTPPPFPYTTLFRSELIGLDIDAERSVRLDRRPLRQHVGEAFETEAAGLVRTGIAGDHIGEPDVERRLEREGVDGAGSRRRSEEHTSELQSQSNLVC